VRVAERCVKLLAEWRANDYHAWIAVLCALKSVEIEADYDLREFWHEFSARCSAKYDADECNRKWTTSSTAKTPRTG